MELKQQIQFNFSNASVAIIDGSVMALEVATSVLSGYGFRRMFRCATLQQGIDALKSHKIDLVLIDPYSFGEDAYSAIRWLRSEQANLNSQTAIIIVTALTRVRQITSSRQCGADYVVAKPFSTTTLLERILWVATGDSRRGDLAAPAALVNQSGSGVDLW